MGKNKRHRPKLVIGLSAETENILQNSKEKLKNKKADWISANDVYQKGIGRKNEYNEVSVKETK